MELHRELTTIYNSCLGLGFFDGVHTGHKELVKELVSYSKSIGKKSVIITFQKSPAEKFYNNVTYLTTSEERAEILSDLGIDYVLELDFDDNLMKITAEDYLKNIIYENFKPKFIISGFNHTFGKERQGNPKLLKDNEEKYGYQYKELPPIKYNDEIISSSLIKKYLEDGNIQKANTLLGYKYTISGTVIKGNQIGKTIGFPTANIKYPETKVEIPYGVYSTNVEVNGTNYKGVLNYGIKPTINKECKPVAEVHIIGFNNDIYGDEIKISITDKIRDEKKFGSVDELKDQIKEDIRKC